MELEVLDGFLVILTSWVTLHKPVNLTESQRPIYWS